MKNTFNTTNMQAAGYDKMIAAMFGLENLSDTELADLKAAIEAVADGTGKPSEICNAIADMVDVLDTLSLESIDANGIAVEGSYGRYSDRVTLWPDIA